MWRRTARDRLFIAFLLLATVTVLTLDFRTGVLDGVASTTTQAFNVFQNGVRSLFRPISSAVQTVSDLATLRDENRDLREENRRLKLQQETISSVARENARFRGLLQLESSAGLEAVHARVIASSLSGLERSATINKGRSAGISRDRAVLAPEGVVGRVSWAGGGSAKVLLLTDARSAIGVRIGESGETGLARGNGRGLELELIERTALDQGAVKEGDTVLTSGQGGIYPPGLPVGKVERVTLAERGTSYSIAVRPYVALSRLDILSVIISTDEVIEAPPSPSPGSEDEAEDQ